MAAIQFQPLIPIALWLALAIAGGAFVAWYAWRRPGAMTPVRWLTAITLEAAALGLVLGVLLNPIFVSPIPPPEGKPLLTILADGSASMAVADESGGAARFQAAAEIASRLERELGQALDVEVRTFAERSRSVSAAQLSSSTPTGQITDIGGAIRDNLDGSHESGQALLLLSDGVHNAGSALGVRQAAETARAMAIPIFAAVLGGPTDVADLEVSLVRQQELTYVRQKATVRALIRQRGRLAGEVDVLLLDEDNQEIGRQAVSLVADLAQQQSTAQATFHVTQDAPGLSRFQVQVQPLAREATAGNNTSSFVLRTIDRPIRVLLLEGKPYWDAKFLMRTLASDDALELDAVVQVANDRFVERRLRLTEAVESANKDKATVISRQETTTVLRDLPPALQSANQLDEYQIVVLGRDAEAFLSAAILERLRTWISAGGSLVCFRGPPMARLSDQLARIMPVRWSPSPEARFRMQLTRRGQEVNWLAAAASGEPGALTALPSLATAAEAQTPSPLAVVVAQAPGAEQPVVSYQPYGQGRVVALEGAGMWRWAFLAPEHQALEPVYAAVWQGLMRWLVSAGALAPGQDVALRTENVSFFTQEPASATLLVRENSLTGDLPNVELSHDEKPVGTFQPLAVGDEPGVYRVAFGELSAGSYRASILNAPAGQTETTVLFDVRPNYGEELDTAARPDLLADVAERSGGALLSDSSADEISRRFREHLAHVRPLQLRETTLWDRWWVLLVIVGLFGAAWTLRRRSGLI